jgi:hypothetical protein
VAQTDLEDSVVYDSKCPDLHSEFEREEWEGMESRHGTLLRFVVQDVVMIVREFYMDVAG